MPDHIQRLKAARLKVAQLLLTDRVYAPIFDRLEREIAAHETENELIDRARAVVQHHKATG
jgi:hypothetical protein